MLGDEFFAPADEIIEGNKLIKLFMGFPTQPAVSDHQRFLYHIRYHSEWQWIMWAVDKIEKTEGVECFNIDTNGVFVRYNGSAYHYIIVDEDFVSKDSSIKYFTSKHYAAWYAIVRFVINFNRYNEYTKQLKK